MLLQTIEPVQTSRETDKPESGKEQSKQNALDGARADAFGPATAASKEALTEIDQLLKEGAERTVGAPATSLLLGGERVTDAGAKYIGQNKELTVLSLEHTLVTDKGIKELRHLSNLGILILSDTKLSDKGLKELGGLTDLSTFYMAGTRITDDGLKSLARMGSLAFLDVSGTKITDAGLQQLARANKSLVHLNVIGTDVTIEGIRRFKEAMPNCSVTSELLPAAVPVKVGKPPDVSPGPFGPPTGHDQTSPTGPYIEMPRTPHYPNRPINPFRPSEGNESGLHKWFQDNKPKTRESSTVAKIGEALVGEVNNFLDYRAPGVVGNTIAHLLNAPRAHEQFATLAQSARNLHTHLDVPHNYLITELNHIRANNNLLQGSPETWTNARNNSVLRSAERPIVEQFQNLNRFRNLLDREAAAHLSLTSQAERAWLAQQSFQGARVGLAPPMQSTVPGALAEYELATTAAHNAQRSANNGAIVRSIGTLIGAEAGKMFLDKHILNDTPAPTFRTHMLDVATPFVMLGSRRLNALTQAVGIVGVHAIARQWDSWDSHK